MSLVCHIRLMSREDIPQVTEIDRKAFPTQMPPPNYKHEMENYLARYIVATDQIEMADEPGTIEAPQKGFSALAWRLRHIFNRNNSKKSQFILGFAGFWIMADEAHITTIAMREKYRRQGIGELLLISLIDLAAEVRAAMVTLEVRASNYPAQMLYSKYGFMQVGLRRGYYTDNGEDAVLMTLSNINSPSVQANLERLKQAHAQRWGIATYQIEKPRVSPAQPGKR